MTFIIKPIVTEKMTKVTEKSSADKKVNFYVLQGPSGNLTEHFCAETS